jgi:hypothetical protein
MLLPKSVGVESFQRCASLALGIQSIQRIIIVGTIKKSD